MDDKQRKLAIRDAAKLVHRKLGTSKRFSEIEKFAISELLAFKLRDMHAQQLEELGEMKRTVRELAEENERKQKSTDAMYCEMTQFVKNHASQLTTHAHDMSTTTDVLLRMRNRRDSDRLLSFFECLDQVLHQVSKAFIHRHVLFYEIDKCYRMLGSKAHHSSHTAANCADSTNQPRRRQQQQQQPQSRQRVDGSTVVNVEPPVRLFRRNASVQLTLYDLLRRRRPGGAPVDDGRDPDPKNVEIKSLTDRVEMLTKEVAEYRQELDDMRDELQLIDAELAELRAAVTQQPIAMDTSPALAMMTA